MRQQIGLIGIGLLGTALAERLLTAGLDVIGFDTSDKQLKSFADLGGTPCRSAAEVVDSCSRIVLSLPTSSIVHSFLDDVRSHLAPGTILLDTTTGPPQDAEQFGGELASLGVSYLDTTVAGSSEQVRLGQGILMIGGDRQISDRCHDLFAILGSKTFFLGPNGSGARMKLVVNLVLGLNRAVLAEGLTLARHCGIDLHLALDVLQSGPARSAVMDSKGLKMVEGNFQPQARLAQHYKDVQLILALGRESQTTLPLSVVHEQLLQRAIAQGYGDLDNSAIIRSLERE